MADGGRKSEDNMLFDRFELPDEEIPDFLKEEPNLEKVGTPEVKTGTKK